MCIIALTYFRQFSINTVPMMQYTGERAACCLLEQWPILVLWQTEKTQEKCRIIFTGSALFAKTNSFIRERNSLIFRSYNPWPLNIYEAEAYATICSIIRLWYEGHLERTCYGLAVFWPTMDLAEIWIYGGLSFALSHEHVFELTTAYAVTWIKVSH